MDIQTYLIITTVLSGLSTFLKFSLAITGQYPKQVSKFSEYGDLLIMAVFFHLTVYQLYNY